MRVMKKFLCILLFALSIQLMNAQLPDGSLAPNFIATDINGNQHELYEYLEQGHTVVLDFFATWCIGCWQVYSGQYYATGPDQLGPMEYLYQEQSVENGGNMILLMIEDDPGTDLGCLYGVPIPGWANSTMGDWVTGNPIAMIDNDSIGDVFGIGGYTTWVIICPDGTIKSTQVDCSEELNTCSMGLVLEDMALNTDCTTIPDIGPDVSIMSYDGTLMTCDHADFSINIANVGNQVLNEINFHIDGCNPPIDYLWQGQLEPFQTEAVDLGSAIVDDDIIITAIDQNGVTTNETIEPQVIYPIPGRSYMEMTIRFDDAPEDVGFTIANAAGDILIDYPVGYFANEITQSTTVVNFELPSGDCYELRMFDGYGDGLTYYMNNGFYQPGTILFESTLPNGIGFSEILDYDGSYSYQEIVRKFSVWAPDAVIESKSGILQIFPNPATEVVRIYSDAQMSNNAVLILQNELGQVVYNGLLKSHLSGEKNYLLDLSQYQQGLYILSIVSDKEKLVGHIVKQ